MHDDFFAWVRLLLLIILILAFIIWVKTVGPYIEQPEQLDRKEPIYLAQATPHTIPTISPVAETHRTTNHPSKPLLDSSESESESPKQNRKKEIWLK